MASDLPGLRGPHQFAGRTSSGPSRQERHGTVTTTGFTVDSATQITATAPAESAGTVDIRSPLPAAPAPQPRRAIHVREPPDRHRGQPGRRTHAGGTTVTITGTNLSGATTVIRHHRRRRLHCNSATVITATAPAGTRHRRRQVTTPGGTCATGQPKVHLRSAHRHRRQPRQTVRPPAAPTVTITGTNLTGATAVNFGTTAATN